MGKRFYLSAMAIMWVLSNGCEDNGSHRERDDIIYGDTNNPSITPADYQENMVDLDKLQFFPDAGTVGDENDSDTLPDDGIGSNASDNWTPDFDQDPGPQQNDETWTVMIYQCADNNLEAVLLSDINEMEAALIPANVNIIVLLDRSPWYDSSDGNWNGAKLFKLTHDDVPKEIRSIRLADPDFLQLSGTSKNGEELDMGSRKTLEDFIRFCQKNFPADHYVLHISDHGNGWRYQIGQPNEHTPNRAISKDDSSGNSLSVSHDIPLAIANKSIETVSFDACFMGTVEVAWALAPHVDYAALSALNVPSAGWNYTDALNRWFEHRSAKNWALNAVKSYQASYYAHKDVGFTAVDLRKLMAWGESLEEFIISLADAPIEDLKRARNQTYRPDNAALAMRDMVDFVERCEPYVGRDVVERFFKTYEEVILYYWYSASQSKLRGLTIYAPGPSSIQGGPYSKTYDQTPFARDTLWNELIIYLL